MRVRPIALFLLCACAAPPQAEPDPPKQSPLQVVKISVRHFPNGSLRRARLAEPATIQGFLCTGAIEFGRDGRLRKFTVAERCVISDIQIPVRSRVILDSEGRLETVWLNYSTFIGELMINGDAPFGMCTEFHPNGQLKSGYLARDTEIQGVLCKASKWRPVRFDESGRLARKRVSP